MALVLLLGFIFSIFLSCEAEQVKFSKQYGPAENRDSLIFGLYDDWWQSATLYQVYTRSFKDSNNDGDGDIQGIIQKLDYFVETGIDAIWISPIYKSPQVDNGYDVSDYRDIDEMYGSLSDLKQLIEEAHKRGLKVILEYVPNHTSDQHEWFNKSVKRVSPYEDYYIWNNGTIVDGQRVPPNNWLSIYRGSAWEWNDERQQYYYHQFSPAQPDLNYRNPAVVQETQDNFVYWLDFGIDGLSLDAVNTLFEDELLRDEPFPEDAEDIDPDDPASLDHIYTSNLNETYDMVYQWREFFDNYTAENGGDTRVMITEASTDIYHTGLYYTNENYTRRGAHFSVNFISFISDTHKGFNAIDLTTNIFAFMGPLPYSCYENWVLGNRDQSRVSTRLGVEHIDFFNVLTALLPSLQITYQGEEIGQENGEVTCQKGYDTQATKNCTSFNETSRDFERTPFQWDNSTNAGFSEANATWLPVSEKYFQTNLADEATPTHNNSHYNIYKSITKLKKEFKNTFSSLVSITGESSNLISIIRKTNHAYYSLVYNIADTEETFGHPIVTNTTGEVFMTGVNSQYAIGDTFDEYKPLKPKELLVMKMTPLDEETQN